ncbi:MAG: CusA/CzcA family heavy metal efflux RND transporter, partial [Thermodesulfobacteriota bacterium]
MIARVIAFSAANKLLVLALTGAALAAAVWTLPRLPLDAIPDLSDTQVIVYSRWDRSPGVIEDQVTYPIVSALLGTPRVKAVRGVSDFGYSYVYVVFEDGTDLYWARSRVLEYLSKILPRLPDGVKAELGPDATSVGWVFQYALRDLSGRHDLAELRSLQDWLLRYHLQSVPGVAEVAAVGGFVKQYQVDVDPNRLLAYDVPLSRVLDAVRRGNGETGGRLLEIAGTEYMVRGRGWVASEEDIEKIVVGVDPSSGAPILVEQLASVTVGPEMRRGVADLDGLGDTVGGIVVMRHGENALAVIERVKKKLEELRPSLPEGVEVVTVYDRAPLIRDSIATLVRALAQEMAIVSLVVLLFLWHLPSALVPIMTIPVAVLLAFIPLYLMGISVNVMSLAGVAISIGVLVDGAIVEVENAYKRLQEWQSGGRVGDGHAVRLAALQEVGPSVFFSLLVIAAAFLPVFALVEQEGRLFGPLAWSKTLAMALAALLAVTLDPALRALFTRTEPVRLRPRRLAAACNALVVGRYRPEEEHSVSRLLFRLYEPACRWVLRHPRITLAAALALVLSAVPPYLRLGAEFMPPLEEGSLLYMPTALPGMSVTEAQRILNVQNRILTSFHEVATVFGKAGRADSSTDPAPLSMVETTIALAPQAEWRRKERWYSGAPELVQRPLRWLWPDRISLDELREELDAHLRLPGIPNIWTMPIRNRVDMLSTGVRTPIGVKVLGPDLRVVQGVAERLESLLRGVRGARSVVAERSAGGYYLDLDLDRDALARHGVTVQDANDVLAAAVGGAVVATTVEGRERYAVRVRFARDFRDDVHDLARVLVPVAGGGQVPLGALARIRRAEGPSMIRNEGGQLAGYVFVDLAGRDPGGFVEEARRLVEREVRLPPGYSLLWSGQYESMARVDERLRAVVPLALLVIALLLYMSTKSMAKVGIVMLAVPFSLVGAVWLLYALGYHLSVAVWVGMIALMGLDAETGVFMLLFLDLSYERRVREGRMRTAGDLQEAIVEGAVKRVRPKLMTVAASLMGLLPLMWSTGTGADAMKRVAAPMVGGLVTSFALELLVYPVLYALWRGRGLPERARVVVAPALSR